MRKLAFGLLLLTTIASGADTTPTRFIFVKYAEPHLGGDPFGIDSVRVNLENGSAQVARVRSDGTILELARGLSDLEADTLDVPQPAPKAKNKAEGPELLIEGGGPTVTIAHGNPDGIVILRFESDDPTQLEPQPELTRFMTHIVGSIAISELPRTSEERVVAQAHPWVSKSPRRIDRRLTEREVDASTALGRLLAHPFELVPIPQTDGFARSLTPGKATVVEYSGQIFTVTTYRDAEP